MINSRCMSSSERSGESSTSEPPPYYRAARFSGEKPAGRAYNQAQETIFTAPDCELSAYRFHLDRVWHVAVVGEQPPQELERQLEKILSRGQPTTLPELLLRTLEQRRVQATRLGPWIEGHYRPGKTL